MFRKLFGSKEQSEGTLIVAQLNARMRPLDRGDVYEDPLDEVLKSGGLGEVTGGGTMLSESGEVEYCDLEVVVNDASPETLDAIVAALETLGAPKGSKLLLEDAPERAFGHNEGIAVYLNGTDLDEDVYKTGEVNFVISEFERLLEGEGRFDSYWEGPRETGLYLYGASAENIRQRIAPFLAYYPLCQKARVEQIA